ncbi:MAG: hypothetical protein BGN96_11700 [Bacteroidales bacterium 45-6]|nr:MAG: hypothetical protein BGN96_11700 [Bacteroidales bacterium 45-6]
METTTSKRKRKNIDLPAEAFTKLSILASAQGKSLKAYIENLLISKADSLKIEISPNPSPSGDPWFDDPENLAIVKQGIEDIKRGDSKVFAMEEIEKLLGA